MKNCYPICALVLFAGALCLLFSACSKSDPAEPDSPQLPTVTTTAVSNVTSAAATAGGTISADGDSPVTAKGVCWSTSPTPTINDNLTSDGTGTGSFTSAITGLMPNTNYYIRAYATNAVGTAYGNQVQFATAAPVIAIGETYEGGIIFYVDGTGQHGLIAAPMDQGTVNWGCEGQSIAGTSVFLGTGMANTQAIVNQCGTAGIAARICNDLVLNGKSDWYLPSKDELNLLHQNLYLNNIGNLKTARYWSSSQYNAQFAWCQFFNLNLNQLYYDKDLIAYPVRAIRSF